MNANAKVGIGCMVDSCRKCDSCRRGEEQYCATRSVATYNSTYKVWKHVNICS
jgi:alcohol dehydrogenase (NADP+)